MKKIVLVLLLAAILSVGAFADHPDGWGVGVGYQYGGSWEAPGTGLQQFTLFLKAPQLPVYWGISADIFNMGSDPSRLGLSLTGDYYLFDQYLVPDIRFGWFLGVGGYLNFQRWASDGYVVFNTRYGDYSYNYFDLGVRVPIGLSIRPIDLVEVFLDVAPQVGLYIRPGYKSGGADVDMKMGLGGGWQGDFGVRFWF